MPSSDYSLPSQKNPNPLGIHTLAMASKGELK